MRIITLFFIQCLLGLSLSAQLGFYQSDQIPVSVDGENLAHAWAGGLNSTQLSTIDINLDGLLDIFIFDRTSSKFHLFLRQNNGVNTFFKESFDFHDDFPKLQHWVLLRDFNCDGKEDIFTSTPAGIKVYKNTSTVGSVSFELETELVRSIFDFGSNPFSTNVYVSSTDIPSIDDFDGDGDLDIHTFTLSGSTIEYHRSMQSENGNCDSLHYELRNKCYGYIGEDAISPQIIIGEEFVELEFCLTNIPDPEIAPDGPYLISESSARHPHAGSSLCMFDYDGNGKKDILIGDISASDMKLCLIDENGSGPDSCTVLEEGFPIADQAIDIRVFNTGFYNDVDNDGDGDLIVSPANAFECEDKAGVWYYKNTNSDADADFSLVQRDFLQQDMLDMGTISFPHVTDLNGDGLTDLLVSNRGFYSADGTFEPEVWRFDNVGSASFPVFELVDDDFQQLSALDAGGYPYPCFGDLDGDNDIDMVVGTGDGYFYYYENSAGPGAEVAYIIPTDSMLDINGLKMDPGQQVTPQLYDLDQDGLLDLICGERNGNLDFYRNVGSVNAPDFVLASESLGSISTDVNGSGIGYSVPYLFDNNGVTNMIIGTEDGYLFHATDIDQDVLAPYTIIDSTAFDIYRGRRSAPVILDIDNDGDLDIINGNLSGGLTLFLGGEFISNLADNEQFLGEITIYPNPSNSFINLDIPSAFVIDNIIISDLLGRPVMRVAGKQRTIDVSTLDAGTYICLMEYGGNVIARTFVKQK